MASVIVRNLSDETYDALQVRAAMDYSCLNLMTSQAISLNHSTKT
jgi:hypothetical protein